MISEIAIVAAFIVAIAGSFFGSCKFAVTSFKSRYDDFDFAFNATGAFVCLICAFVLIGIMCSILGL